MKFIELGDETVELSSIKRFNKTTSWNGSNHVPQITVEGIGVKCSANFHTIEERDKQYLRLLDTVEQTTKGVTMESIKAYLDKHKDIFLTIGVILVLDHFVFGGVFREKLKNMINGFLDCKTKELK